MKNLIQQNSKNHLVISIDIYNAIWIICKIDFSLGSTYFNGSSTIKVVPFPSWELKDIVPPCISTIGLEILTEGILLIYR